MAFQYNDNRLINNHTHIDYPLTCGTNNSGTVTWVDFINFRNVENFGIEPNKQPIGGTWLNVLDKLQGCFDEINDRFEQAEKKLYKELYTAHLMETKPMLEAPLTGYSERLSFLMIPRKQLFYDGIVNGKPEKIKNGVYTYVLGTGDTNRAYLDSYGGSAIQYDSNIKCIKLTPGQVFITFPNNVEVYCIIVEAVAVKRSSSVADTTITPGLFSSSVSMEAVSDNVEESDVYLFSFEKSHLESIKDPTTNRYQVITDNWGSDECYLYLKFTVGYNIKEPETPAVS